MCNCYDLANHHIPWHEDLERLTGLPIPLLDKPLNIRKTDPGLVLHDLDGGRKVSSMRWGFHRHFNPAVNNTRSDKLDSGMWLESWEKRRCVIPVSAYYEWSGPKGSKQTHAFTGAPGSWLWAAGIWEETPEQGLCFSMITVNPNSIAEAIHSRMPALLAINDLDEYLESDDPRDLVQPFAGEMRTFPCKNPLKMKEPSPPVPMEIEQELF